MRHIAASPDFRAGFTEMLPACLGLIPFGLVTGVGAAAAGANFWGALGMSAIIFSGAAQILASQLLAAGAPVGVVILTCFVAGLRVGQNLDVSLALNRFHLFDPDTGVAIRGADWG